MTDLSRFPAASTAAGVWRGLVPAVALAAADLIPLAGVLWLGWDVATILVLYWLESGVIGVVNVFKLRRASAPEGDYLASRMTLNGTPITHVSRGALIGFFVMHYGIFWVVHGIVALGVIVSAAVGDAFLGTANLATATGRLSVPGIVLALLALIAVHAASYWFEFVGRREYERVSPGAQMFAPYPRVIALHVTILAGAFVVLQSGQPTALVALLVGVKTVIDLVLFIAARRRGEVA